jgi:hypothetical protein
MLHHRQLGHKNSITEQLSPFMLIHPNIMSSIKTTQTMHNHLIEELHRLYREIDSSSKIS